MKFWEIKNEAENDTAEILIYGQIADQSWWDSDVDAKQFADDLKACGGKDITLRINSPGGDIFAAQAIYSMLKTYKGKVTAHIDGICASAATVVACGADAIVMPRNALYMIHNPMAVIMDRMDAEALTKMAETMEKVKSIIVSVYVAKAGEKSNEEEISKLMDDETWMDAEDALSKGLIDEIDDYQVQTQMKAGLMVVNSVSMPVDEKEMPKIKNIIARKGKAEMNDSEIISKIKAVLGMEPKENKEDAKVVAERKRLEELDALKAENATPYVVAAVDAFKTMPGITVAQVKTVVNALANVKEEPVADERINAITQLIQDNLDSGASGVKAEPQVKNDAQAKNQAVADIVNRINKIRGTK